MLALDLPNLPNLAFKIIHADFLDSIFEARQRAAVKQIDQQVDQAVEVVSPAGSFER